MIAMKMIMAIVQNIDAETAINALIDAGYRVTRVATTGGFFHQGNTTFLMGVSDDQVEAVIGILREHCQARTRLRSVTPDPTGPVPIVGGYLEVKVGGATVFVFDVEHYEQF
jgi:uncharacterized protein YaaQ